MKKQLLAAMFGLGLLCAGAQADGLGVFGSYWTPAEGGSLYGGGLRFRDGVDVVYFGLRGTYYENIIPVDLSLGLQFAPIDKLDVYGGAGVSYYFLGTGAERQSDELGWLLEAGGEITVTPSMGLFAEVVWRDVRATVENDRLGDINSHRVDTNLDGAGVNVGLIFR